MGCNQQGVMAFFSSVRSYNAWVDFPSWLSLLRSLFVSSCTFHCRKLLFQVEGIGYRVLVGNISDKNDIDWMLKVYDMQYVHVFTSE